MTECLPTNGSFNKYHNNDVTSSRGHNPSTCSPTSKVTRLRHGIQHRSSFDEVLDMHRASLEYKVDSLRTSLEQFDKKCRDHIGLNLGELRRRRSDGDSSLLAYCQTVTMGADPTTSESDTDESVIEVFADGKMRQHRATQTNLIKCSCRGRALGHFRSTFRTSLLMRDAVTQTSDIKEGCDETIKENTSEQLLVFEILAMHRSNNGIRQSHERTKDLYSSVSLSNQQHALNSSQSLLDGSVHRALNCTPKSNVSKRNCEQLAKPISPRSHNYLCDHTHKDLNGCVGDNEVISEVGYGVHIEDDLWRLAEEGRLPWSCDMKTIQLRTFGDTQDIIMARLAYVNELNSLSTPVGLFTKFKSPKVYLPRRRWISIPPSLDVIPE